jgi:hypothetical protein
MKKISNELAIAVLEKKVERLEKTIREFMDNWGPDVQKKIPNGTMKNIRYPTNGKWINVLMLLLTK